MRRHPTSTAAGALFALALVLTLAGCGGGAEAEEGGGNTPSAATPSTSGTKAGVGKTPTKGGTSDEPAASVPIAKDSAVPPVAPGEEMTQQDLKAMLLATLAADGTARIKGVETTPGSVSRSEGVYSRSDGKVALDVRSTVEGTEELAALEVHLVLVGDHLYQRSAMSGDQYTRTTVGDGGAAVNLAHLDPVAALETYADAITQVVHVGKEKKDGKKLTRYDVTVQPEAVADGVADPFTYVVYFNASGQIARVEIEMGPEVSTVTTYSEWGKKHTVSAPPADKVLELPGA
ncbi:hypothetical protein [Nocardioides yefusunii]|uniref:Lipoprotein n=1 Tax=Nocardioides yefusunii TaxID=2500546 RepID=A0ABW1QUH1_9ACTN|nr:hypothetical protein [Nocardioides yefusunii]